MNVLSYPLVLALVTGPREGAPQALHLGVLRPASEAVGSACAINVDVLQRAQHIGNGVGGMEYVPSLGLCPASEERIEIHALQIDPEAKPGQQVLRDEAKCCDSRRVGGVQDRDRPREVRAALRQELPGSP